MLARIDLKADFIRGFLESISTNFPEEIRERARGCGIDLVRDQSTVEVALAGRPPVIVADIKGAINTSKVACAIKAAVMPHGRVESGDAVVMDVPGGIRVTVGAASQSGGETPKELVKEFGDSASTPAALLATLGPATRPYDLAVLIKSRDSIRVRLRLPSAEDAKAFHSWLTNAVARGTQDGLSALDAIKPMLHQRDVTVDVAAGLPLAMGIRAAVVEAFNFPTASMAPTLLMGDRIFVAKGAFAKVARRGDLAAFRAPGGQQTYVKRVVGVGGDRVQIRDGKVSLNGIALATRLEDANFEYEDLDEEAGTSIRRKSSLWREEIDGHPFLVIHTDDALDEAVDITVPEGHVYVLGDNRDHSQDSRRFGPVPLSEITGRAIVLWWSSGSNGGIRWDRIGQFLDGGTNASAIGTKAPSRK